MHKIDRAILVGVVSLTLGLAACGTTKNSGSAANSSSGSVKTDFGVTNSTITLGAMTDESGVFKVAGISLTEGNELWAADVNKKGGVCGRKIKLDIRDNGYNAEKAVTLYGAMRDNVAGMVQLLGSPIIAALKSSITSDNMLSVPASWATGNLASPVILQVGATYAIEIINGLAYLQQQGLIKDGDKLGHIYIDSEYGDDGFMGTQAYAKDHNMTVVGVKVAGTDNDMTSAITSLKSQGVAAVLLTTSPDQTGSAAAQMAAQGIGQLPLLGNNPVFVPNLLQTPAKSDLANFFRVSPGVPFDSGIAIAKQIATEYSARFTDPPQDAVDLGYAFGLAFQTVLEKACSNKDMTRAGIVKAAREVKVDTKGLTAPLDYSKPGEPPTRATLVEQVDPAAKGGLKVVSPFTASMDAKNFVPPAK